MINNDAIHMLVKCGMDESIARLLQILVRRKVDLKEELIEKHNNNN